MDTSGQRFAAVVLAHDARDDDAGTIQSMVDAAHAAGADPVVVVLPRGRVAPTRARIVHVGASPSRISATRAGMALLANTTVRFLLLWPYDPEAAASPSETPLQLLVDDAEREGSAMTALAGADLDRSAVLIARDSWLDVMTLGEQGLDAVAARIRLRTVPRR